MVAANDTDERAPATGDAAAASAEIEAWLKQRATGPSPADWQGCLAQMKSALMTLCASKLVRTDDRAKTFILRLLSAENMDDFATGVDLLGDRIAELTGITVGQRWRAPVVNIASFEQRTNAKQDKPDGQDAGCLPRMVLRL